MNPLHHLRVVPRTLTMAAGLAWLAGCGVLPRVGPDYVGPPQTRSHAMAQAAATGASKVEFFTMVRGE